MADSEVHHGHVPGAPSIAYTELGSGRPLVFLHGIGGNSGNWIAQQTHFARHGYRAIAWDVRGYGQSEDFPGEFSFAEVSDDLVRLLDHLGLRHASFVGLSMGGRILMDFVHRYPERVAALVICGSFPSFDKSLSDAQRNSYLELRRKPLLEGKSFAELAPKLVDSLLSPSASAQVRQRVIDSIGQLRRESYLKALAAAESFDRSAEIGAIRKPVLLIYAEADKLTPPPLGREVADTIPQSQFVVIPGAGHLMNIEAPEFFNATVAGFLAGVKLNQQEELSQCGT